MGPYAPVLTEVLVRKIDGTNVVRPVVATVADILAGGFDSTLVTLEATVLRRQQLGQRSTLELQSEQRAYQAIFPPH